MDCAPQFDDVCATRQRSSKVRPTGGGKSEILSGFRSWFFGERQLISAIRTNGRSICTIPKRPLLT